MKKLLLLAVPLVALLSGCGRESHFITDKEYRNQVHEDFEGRKALAEGRAYALFAGMDTLSQREREALEFLYAYMPYSDLADYDGAFFLKQVRYAFAAQELFNWRVPEDIFRHFVLVYRVNNEDLDTARMVMFEALKDRVKGLSMEAAALEVNHWCHEYVAYRAADIRTSAPLATMRTSLGRCGEESTFAVTALRSVGIPARQCYTPRWAHCDDNHAWVEVWVDGSWKFLGACEPDPHLDMGWFSVPSTRCMMVHTKAFGRYHGDEEVVKSTSMYSELNLLSHYAPTRHVTAVVKDGDGKPVGGASVKFKLYNYSEYYTLATVTTDADGCASLTTGLGDLLVWACKGDRYGYEKMDVRNQDSVELYLWHDGLMPNSSVELFDIVPPVAGNAKVTASDEEQQQNNARLKTEDSIRNAYVSSFPTKDNYMDIVESNGNLDSQMIWDIIHRSEGNYQVLASFLNRHSYQDGDLRLYSYLMSFSDKDLRDISLEVLEDQLRRKGALDLPDEVYVKGLLPARISNELVRPWRSFLEEALPKAGLKATVASIKDWTETHVSVDDTGNYYGCPVSPRGVFELRHCDAHSRDIFFVAACRALQVPAYLDNAVDEIYVWQNGAWETVSFAAQESKPTATLTLTYRGKEPALPVYWSHFALAKYCDGDFVTFDFENDSRLSHFPATLQLAPGFYCLYTGNRYADGEVLSRVEFFELKTSETKEIVVRPLVQRAACGSLPKIDAQMALYDDMATLADYAGSTGMVYINMGDYREPSKHLVKELKQQLSALKRWGGMIYMVVPEQVNALEWNLPNADIVTGHDGQLDRLGSAVFAALKKSGSVDGGLSKVEYPLVATINRKGEISFHSMGYKIGLAEQLLRSL